MSKFVGKFRKNKDYNDDYNFMHKRKHRDEHSEVKKIKKRTLEEFETEYKFAKKTLIN